MHKDITNYIEDPRVHGGPIVGQSNTSHLPIVKDALVEEHKVATMACGLLEKEKHI